ncbi:class I SAM-dependent methyltransferase family protein [Candidatus Bathyarchaeota archaeon]|nr:class I SAM-dependent methyltransferase family protein [Candidatus Bathyarchaeota archaeon]
MQTKRTCITIIDFCWRLITLKTNIKTVLADKIEPKQLNQLYKTYDIVGDIAIIRLPEQLKHLRQEIAKAIMIIQREVKSVWMQASSVSGDYRLRNLEFVYGKETTKTTYKEYGCIYKTDLKKTYFSPRLSYERMRIAKHVQKQEIVLNMFAGVGCYSIAIARHAEPRIVYSVDVNPSAFYYLKENIRINRVEKTVVGLKGDAKTVTQEKLKHAVDRILMPLPELAYDYLEFALLALKPKGGWIHYYDFEHAKKNEDPVTKIASKVSQKLNKLYPNFQVTFGRIVRTIGPRWYQIVLDIHVQ